LLEQAIEKIETEIKESKESYVVMVGKCMIDHIENNPADAVAIMAEGKTIAGSLAFMEEKARKNAAGGYAMFTPDEGFTIIMEYYGLNGTNMPTVPEKKNRIDLDVDALLDI